MKFAKALWFYNYILMYNSLLLIKMIVLSTIDEILRQLL